MSVVEDVFNGVEGNDRVGVRGSWNGEYGWGSSSELLKSITSDYSKLSSCSGRLGRFPEGTPNALINGNVNCIAFNK